MYRGMVDHYFVEKVMIEVEAKLCLMCTMVWYGLNSGKVMMEVGSKLCLV
jgi:hypothetical protein